MVLGIYGSGGAGRDILGLIYSTEQENKWDEIVLLMILKMKASL